ncbi:PadR family transcriptional regulator [Gemmatimonas sp.]|jgi:PadR family transcriptional regulator PadR|uniref:PadR family transcriptional regulator n=1 Tax=Gemmatimonas sp. TaxID=1962908 RepID=UPI0037C0ABBA
MKPNWFYILLSLSSGARYGTAIQDDVRTLSDGAVRLWPATLYGSLEELVGKGWLEEVSDDERPEVISGRERFYRITPPGRAALKAEVERIEGLARVARQRLALRTVTS